MTQQTSPAKRKIWFPAKRYGWGWGIPCAWQGWAVLGAWLALVLAGTPLLPKYPVFFSIHVLVLTAMFIVVCCIKGEKLRWRWGKN